MPNKTKNVAKYVKVSFLIWTSPWVRMMSHSPLCAICILSHASSCSFWSISLSLWCCASLSLHAIRKFSRSSSKRARSSLHAVRNSPCCIWCRFSIRFSSFFWYCSSSIWLSFLFDSSPSLSRLLSAHLQGQNEHKPVALQWSMHVQMTYSEHLYPSCVKKSPVTEGWRRNCRLQSTQRAFAGTMRLFRPTKMPISLSILLLGHSDTLLLDTPTLLLDARNTKTRLGIPAYIYRYYF